MQKSVVREVTAWMLLGLVCLLPLFAAAQEELGAEEELIFLPQGMWSVSEAGEWMFVIAEDTPLNESQRAEASGGRIELPGEILPAGFSLTQAQLELLYPDAQSLFPLPRTVPQLEMFELTGEWYYGEDDVLYYRHDETSEVMTKDEVFASLNGKEPASPEAKIVYLTIDDAPSHYTMELLAVLELLDVKATFFVVGAYVKNRPVFMRAIYEQGHAIANHSYSHNERILKSTYQACLNDFRRCEEAVAQALGFELSMPILRVPYGASTIPVAYRSMLQDDGYLWIDWNALNGDTESQITSDQKALDRAISTARRYDGSIVMLVHDGKKRTIRTLPELVEHFRSQGYTFEVLDTNIEKIPGVRMGLPTAG